MTQQTLGVVGLGYVGLPLAVEFGKLVDTVGFDLSEAKVAAYRNHSDPTGEVSTDDLKAATKLICTNDVSMLAKGFYFIHIREADGTYVVERFSKL